jgi:hypothetical protein
VVVLGAILLHLRDPFRALQSVSRLSSDAIIVADLHFASDLPVMRFLPDRKSAPDTWWLVSDACTAAMLGVLGFAVRSRIRADPLAVHGGRAQRVTFSTHVAPRDAR